MKKSLLILFFAILFFSVSFSQTIQMVYQSDNTYEDGSIIADEVDPFIVVDEDNNRYGLCFTRNDHGSGLYYPKIRYAFKDFGVPWDADTYSPYASAEYIQPRLHIIDSGNRILSFRTTTDFTNENSLYTTASWCVWRDPNSGTFQSERSENSFSHISYRDYASLSNDIHFLSAYSYNSVKTLKYYKRNSDATYSSAQTVVASNDLWANVFFDLTTGENSTPYFIYRVGNNLKVRRNQDTEITIKSDMEGAQATWNAKLFKISPPVIAYNAQSGNLMIVFSDYDDQADRWCLYYSIKYSGIASWTSPVKVYENSIEAIYPTIVADKNSGDFFVSFLTFDSEEQNYIYLNMIRYYDNQNAFDDSPYQVANLGDFSDAGNMVYHGRPIHSVVLPYESSTTLIIASLLFQAYNDVDVAMFEFTFPSTKTFTFRNVVIDEDAGGQLKLTNNTTSSSETFNSGSSRSLNVSQDYTIETLPRLFEDYEYQSETGDYQHYDWNHLDEKYLLELDLEQPASWDDEQNAYYNEIKSINLNSPVNIEIHDPWYYDVSTQTQPDCSRSISPGSYSVFLNENESFSSTSPIYIVKTPKMYITSNNICVFDHWGAVNAEFNSNHDTTTTNRETSVVFKSADATVTAHYVSANQNGRTVTIANGESLSLPAGGDYSVANDNFRLIVQGTLNTIGTENDSITFPVANSNIVWKGIKVQSGGVLNCSYTSISSADTAIIVSQGVEATIHNSTFTDCCLSIYSSDGIVSIEGCLFKQSQEWVGTSFIKMAIAQNDNETYKIYNNTLIGNAFHCGIIISFNDEEMQFDKNKFGESSFKSIDEGEHGKILMYNNILFGLANYGIDILGSDLYYHVVEIRNNCFYNNEEDIQCEPEGVSIGDNLYCNPLFINPSSGNYHLQSTSPCIDAGKSSGTAYYDQYDPDNTIKDIGAYYFDFVPDAPYLISVTWVSSHPKLLWNKVADLDIETYRVYKTYVNASGTRTTTFDVGSDTTYTDPEITYVNPRYANTTATYKVTAIDSVAQESAYSNTRSVSGNGPLWKPWAEKVVDLPTVFALHPAYPNPFNPITQIRFDVPSTCMIHLEVFDVLGRPVRTMVAGECAPGYYALEWDGRNDNGQNMGTGIYFIKMRTSEYQHLEKCTLIK